MASFLEITISRRIHFTFHRTEVARDFPSNSKISAKSDRIAITALSRDGLAHQGADSSINKAHSTESFDFCSRFGQIILQSLREDASDASPRARHVSTNVEDGRLVPMSGLALETRSKLL